MIENIKNIANIGFFIVISTIAILTYLQARKTLFAPIRTETFKLQLKSFEEVLVFFQNKSESDFLSAFDLNRITSLNTLRMADSYVGSFFHDEITIDKKQREEKYSVLIGAVISIEHAEKYFLKIDASTTPGKLKAEDEPITNPAILLSQWQKYEHGMVEYTANYSDQIKELDRLAASPILPKELRELIGEFSQIANENLSLVGKAITEIALKMPEHCPRASDLKRFSSTWVWNDFNEKRKKFEPTSKKILDHINSYLKVEEIMK